MKPALTLIFAITLIAPVSATIINVPGDSATIQAGINAGTSGDTVRVAPGTYYENINFNGRNIVVGSWFLDGGDPSYISSTRIDGNAVNPVVAFSSGENNTAVITGFTIRNGNGFMGGGIYCSNSSPVIADNLIRSNFSIWWGGGIYCSGSSPTISNNTITQNTGLSNGSGIYCNNSSPHITNTILWGDIGTEEVYLEGSSSPVITYCDVQGGWTGEGNVNCNPLFCSPGGGNFYLRGASCCVGAGEAGDDIGAYGVGCAFLPIILSVMPFQNELNVPLSSEISVTFDIDMDSTTIRDSTFVVTARSTGMHPGTITYDGPSRTATLDPTEDFDEGEMVTVTLTTGIESNEGIHMENPFVWSFISAVGEGSGIFAAQSVFVVGNAPYKVFPADLDGDGDMDLATANAISDNVSVLLNNGDGTFATHSDYPAGDYPYSIFSADLDGDGDMDLTVANYYSDNVSVLLNNGDGTFAAPSDYAAGDGVRYVFPADLDGDGDMDLATSNYISDSISVMLNNGDGTFATHSDYLTGDGPASIYSGDLDGDGDMDLATANYFSDNVSVLLNNGNGTFAAHSDYTAGNAPWSVFGADLDGDSDMDLATANDLSDDISVMLNNGDGTFATHSDYTVGDEPVSVCSADLDGDGHLDLATANAISDNVSVLLNNGDGTFAAHSVYPSGDSPRCVFAADLDGDGDLDLTTANHDSNNVSVLLNLNRPHIVSTVPEQNDLNVPVSTDISATFDMDINPATFDSLTFMVFGRSSGRHSGTISYDAPSRTATFDPVSDLQPGEVVSAVLTDAILSGYGTSLKNGFAWQFSVASDDGSGTFPIQVCYAAGDLPRSVFAADLDGDGDLDLAAANEYSDNVSVLLSNGDGTFADAVNYAAGNGPASIFAGDLDGDGDLDLATANINGDNASVLINAGDGTFGAPVNYAAGDYSCSVIAADLDGDGDLDLAAANRSSDNVSVLMNNGDGTFTTPVNFGAGDVPYSIFAADLDGDGDLDLATANHEGPQIAIILNNGNGTFAAPSGHGSPNSHSSSVSGGDFDGDGDLDLATANYYYDNVTVLLNNGDGTYSQVHYPGGNEPSSIFAADLDGDGDLDLAAANEYSDNVSVFFNNCDGTFDAQVTYTAGDGLRSVFAADLDGDGDLDLATANANSDSISVLLNVDSPGIIAGTVTDSESQPIESVYVELNTAALNAGLPNGIMPVNKANPDKIGSSKGGILLDVVDSVYTDENGYYEFTIDAGIYDLFFSHLDYTDTSCTGLIVTPGDTTIMNMQLFTAGCDYVTGDVNGSDSYNGLDITYGVNFFKGGSDPMCPLGSCPIPPCDAFFYCGDVNGSCSYNGLDITYGVNYFKGGADPIPCGSCPPEPMDISEDEAGGNRPTVYPEEKPKPPYNLKR